MGKGCCIQSGGVQVIGAFLKLFVFSPAVFLLLLNKNKNPILVTLCQSGLRTLTFIAWYSSAHNSGIIFQACTNCVAWVYQKMPPESSASCPVVGHGGQQPMRIIPPCGDPLGAQFWKEIFPHLGHTSSVSLQDTSQGLIRKAQQASN